MYFLMKFFLSHFPVMLAIVESYFFHIQQGECCFIFNDLFWKNLIGDSISSNSFWVVNYDMIAFFVNSEYTWTYFIFINISFFLDRIYFLYCRRRIMQFRCGNLFNIFKPLDKCGFFCVHYDGINKLSIDIFCK